jgi:hypothetical protein
LGSGFFVSPRVFVTCAHVLMHPANPHQDGDRYDLVQNLSTGIRFWQVSNAVVGTNVHVFPDSDLAVLIVDGNQDRVYLPLEYGDLPVGMEIGIAGYPIPILTSVGGILHYDGLIFRVAKNVLTATYQTNISVQGGPTLTNIPLLEVNFLFVPGNSGGPIFAADTGRVLGFVHGFRMHKIVERIETVTLIQNLPPGVSNKYVDSQSALYSIGVRLSHVRAHLEGLGVSL